MEAAKSTEIEWQFEAPDLEAVERWVGQASPVEGVTISPSDGDDHLDTYLDTGDGRLDHAGYSVRLRRRPARPAVATLKSLGSAKADSPLVRLELEEELEADEPAAVARAPGPVGERVRDLIGSDELIALFDVLTRRRVFLLEPREAPTGELLLDETEIREPGGSTIGHLRRVEVELPEPAVSAIRPLVERLQHELGLEAAKLSKYEAARAIIRNG
jgi:inorganic triphosphatase YgiF